MSYIGNNLENDISTRRYEYTATAGQTVFPCTYDKGVDVYLNGFCLSNTDYTATDGVSIVLNTGASAGQIVIIKAYVSVMNLPQSIMEQHTYTATASQTTFSINYTIGFVYVFVNGIRLANTDYTATNGTSVILNDSCNAGDIVECISFNTFAVANAVPRVTSTNNSIARFDGVTGAIKNSGVTIDDSGNVTATQVQTSSIANTNGTVAMNINSSGQVGINNSNPSYPLDVYTTATSTTVGTNIIADFSSNGNGYDACIRFNDNVNASTKIGYSSGSQYFITNGTERMRIDNSGRMIMASYTSSAGKGIISSGNISGITNSPHNATIWAYNTQNDPYPIGATAISSTQGLIGFFDSAGTVIGGVYRTGTSTVSYNTSSDYRLKENIEDMVGATDRLKALKPINFAWKVDGHRVDGFLAHELQEVVPEAATGTKDAVDEEGNPVYQGIDQSKLVPLLTKALQEAVARIEALEAKLGE